MKKLIAFLIILAVVLTGVFAEEFQFPTATVTLKGKIGEFFEHGVHEGVELVSNKTIDNNDVLKAEGWPIQYGYKTNKSFTGKLYMDFTHFEASGGKVIRIAQVTVNGNPKAYVAQKGIAIFDSLPPTANGGGSITSVPIRVYAAQTYDEGGAVKDAKDQDITDPLNTTPGALDGTYIATLTFTVVPE